MATSNTILFNTRDATEYFDPLAGLAERPHYMIAAKSTPWPDDLVKPSIDKSITFTDYKIYEETLFGKRIGENDLMMMAKRYNWTYGTVYDYYNPDDPELKEKSYFVVSPEAGAYHVFKCLNNAVGSKSLYPPKISETSVGDSQYYTADGYHWKFIYTISSALFQKFSTPAYVPVFANAEVATLAVDGAISSVIVDSGGASYFSHTSGVFDEIAVNGNTSVFAIAPTQTVEIRKVDATSVGTFVLSEFVTQATSGATGRVRLSNTSTVILDSINGRFQAGLNIVGASSAATTNVATIFTTGSSSNNNFYTGSVLYIKSGAGAGELRDIVDYNVDGARRLVAVNTPFSALPDLTSAYDISPKVNILGDGEGAKAISVVNVATESVESVIMINEGRNYTYANVFVTGNTGGLVIANSAVVRAMVSPKGGHGSDPVSEFDASHVGVSTSFLPEDDFIPQTNSYRRIGILAGPEYRGVVLTVANNTGLFSVGETVIQRIQERFEIPVYNAETYDFSWTYDIDAYEILQFSTPVAFATNNYVRSPTGNTYGVVIDKITQNSILVRKNQGAWVNSAVVMLNSNSAVNATISSISGGYLNGIIYGLDMSNTDFVYSASSDKIQVFVDNTAITSVVLAAPSDPQFSVNSTAISITNIAITANSIVYVDKYQANSALDTLLSNTELFVTGTVVASNSTTVTLDNVDGLFSSGEILEGQSSTTVGQVVKVEGQEETFDNRVKLTGAYEIGSLNFAAQDKVYQYDSSNNILAFGTIHEVEAIGGNDVMVSLTEVKGIFEITAGAVNKYISNDDATKIMNVVSGELPHIVPYSGSILYAENILPVTRSPDQTEDVRVVLSFY